MISVLSETQERFLLAIGTQLPLERVIEIHLFQPMRQGGVESGVAVVAAVPDGEPLPSEEPSAGEFTDTGVGEHESSGVRVEPETAGEPEPAEARRGFFHRDGGADIASESQREDDPYGDGSMDADGHDAADDTERTMEGVEESGDGEVRMAQERPRRYTVYSAHYRHVLKGPDRGKWEVSVVAEADAPLLTVDVVVRGVLRRSGDATEPERLTGDEMRKALQQTGAGPGTAPGAAPRRMR